MPPDQTREPFQLAGQSMIAKYSYERGVLDALEFVHNFFMPRIADLANPEILKNSIEQLKDLKLIEQDGRFRLTFHINSQSVTP